MIFLALFSTLSILYPLYSFVYVEMSNTLTASSVTVSFFAIFSTFTSSFFTISLVSTFFLEVTVSSFFGVTFLLTSFFASVALVFFGLLVTLEGFGCGFGFEIKLSKSKKMCAERFSGISYSL